MLLTNMGAYNNYGTVSGSSLKEGCDGKSILERILDYYIPISDGHWANFRGSNIHNALENIKVSGYAERFKNWQFEERYYAILWPDDSITPAPDLKDLADAAAKKLEGIKVPTKEQRDEIFGPLIDAIKAIKAKGGIVMSGQIDAFDAEHGILWDYKTAKFISQYFTEKVVEGGEYNLQLRQYKMLLELFGFEVRAVKVSAMDAEKEVTYDVPTKDNPIWIRDFLIPRVRLLARLKTIDNVRDAKGYLKVNYLCDEQNKQKKTYCGVKSQCPLWHPELYETK